MTFRVSLQRLLAEPLSDEQLLVSVRDELRRLERPSPPLSEPQIRDVRASLRRFSTSTEVIRFCDKHKITLPHNEFWYLCNLDERFAVINGLENSRGIPRISNGVEVWIERPDGTLFKGHRDWLRYDKRKPSSKPREANSSSSSSTNDGPTRVSHIYVVAAREALRDLQRFAESYKRELAKDLPTTITDERALAPFVKEYWERIHTV